MLRTPQRVVITGIGLISPLGNDAASNWHGLIAGRSGIGAIRDWNAEDLPVRIGGEVRDFDPSLFIEKKEIKKMDEFTQFAVAAAQMAMDDSGLASTSIDRDRFGVIVGAAMGGIATMEEYHLDFLAGGVKKLSPFFIPRLIANMAAGHVAIRFGLGGVNYCTASACASGAHAVGEAFRLVRWGYQDAMIAGGSEAGVTPMTIAGFAAMRALSTRNDEPERASRPFDRERDGLVVAEGAGLVILENATHAAARGAKIYAEVIGYGANSDAYHITTPAPEGAGAAKCLQLALDDAEIAASDVDYINAHGTSTPYNDSNETVAIKRVFGEHASKLAISSTKSMIGHTLGAAGGIEAAFAALTIANGVIPPTINYDNPDPECDLDYVPNRARNASVDVALSSSFGFGGTNACLVLRKWADGKPQ